MKNLQKLFYAFITLSIISVLMTSCEREFIVAEDIEGLETNVVIEELEGLNTNIVIEELDGFKDFDELIQQITEKSENVEVEYATLSKINEVMMKNGLEPFKESDLNRAIQSITNYDCTTWRSVGDYNNDGRFSVTDYISARNYLCNSAAGCNNHLITNGHPTDVIFFGMMSYLLDGTEFLILNSRDLDIAWDFIGGHIACN